MFQKTKEALSTRLEKITRLTFVFSVITQLFYIGYLVYSVIAQKGIQIANIILTVISVVYFIFFLINERKEGKDAKEAKAKNKKFKKWGKRFVKLYTLGIALYSMYFNIVDAGILGINWISLISNIFMIGLWFYQVYLDLLLWFIKRQIQKIKEKVGQAATGIKTKAQQVKMSFGKKKESLPEE